MTLTILYCCQSTSFWPYLYSYPIAYTLHTAGCAVRITHTNLYRPERHTTAGKELPHARRTPDNTSISAVEGTVCCAGHGRCWILSSPSSASSCCWRPSSPHATRPPPTATSSTHVPPSGAAVATWPTIARCSPFPPPHYIPYTIYHIPYILPTIGYIPYTLNPLGRPCVCPWTLLHRMHHVALHMYTLIRYTLTI